MRLKPSVQITLLALLSSAVGCDAPQLDAGDGFTPSHTYETLQDAKLKPSGRISNDYADEYIRLLGLADGDTVQATFDLLHTLDWPTARNVDEAVYYPAEWYSRGCETIDTLTKFEACVLDLQALDPEYNESHQQWLDEYLAYLPSPDASMMRASESTNSVCRCDREYTIGTLKAEATEITVEAWGEFEADLDVNIDAIRRSGSGGAEYGGAGGATYATITVTPCVKTYKNTGRRCDSTWWFGTTYSCEIPACEAASGEPLPYGISGLTITTPKGKHLIEPRPPVCPSEQGTADPIIEYCNSEVGPSSAPHPGQDPYIGTTNNNAG